MARPEREKRICQEPLFECFAPVGIKVEKTPISLSIEEYETIRWIDLEGTSREECAAYMDIARTTAQAIYNSARAKIAEALINGRELRIEGGKFRLCDGTAGCKSCCRLKNTKYHGPMISDIIERTEKEMRIAVTYEEGKVFQHFGRTELFKIYDVEGMEIKKSDVYGSNGVGHGALAGVLADAGVEILICGGIGGGAMQALANAGIQVIAGASGDVDEAVGAYLAGNLVSTGSNCDHHHHEEGHSCGDHGCGHSCH